MDTEPPAIIRSTIDPYFSDVLIEGFGCGIYTLLFCQTIWKLYNKGGKYLYSSALVILWITTMVSFTGDWATARTAFVSNNISPLSILENLFTSVPLLPDIAAIIAASISDAIIIWRCHILWQSKIILCVLITLLCTTIGFALYGHLFRNAPLSQLMQALAVFSSFITTVSATFFITLKITLVTRKIHTRRHYARVIEILVQSAAILSIVALGLAITGLMDFIHPFDLSTASGNFFYQLYNYLVYAQAPISGIAPTLIAFRVATEPSQTEVNAPTKTGPPSWLRFRKPVNDRDTTTNAAYTTVSMESA